MALKFLNNGYFAGKVGIGDSTPSVKLQVSTDSPTNNVAVSIGGGWVGNSDYHKEGGLLLISGTSQDTTQTGAGIAFQTRNTANTNYWKSSMIMDRDGAIRFTLGGAGTTAGSEDFTILSSGNVGIGISTPTSKLHINQSVTDPDLDFPSSFAVEIDSNHSGSAATTGDREQGGLYIDVDSSTTGGDTSNEHRLYGIYNTVNHSGDSDAVYGTYSSAEQNTTAGTTTNLFAVNATAISDGGANAAVTNLGGVYGAASMQDSTPVGNSHAGKFLNNSISNRAGLTSNTYGISAEIQIDSTSVHTNLYAGRFSIDSNAAYTATSSYLLYLDYQGTSLATNTYAIYSLSDVKSYHEGDFGIGTASPATNLEVSSATGGVLRLTSTDTTVLTGESIGKIEFKSNDASAGGDNVMGFIDSVATNVGTRYALSFGTGDAAAAVERMNINNLGAVKFNNYDSTNQTGTPTYLLGTDTSGNIVKTNTVPGSAAGPYLPLAGGTMTGTNGVLMPDNFKLKFGDATTPDLEIYHNGSNSFIDEGGTGDLFIRSTNGDGVYIYAGGTGSSNKRVFANSSGSVDLYYGSTKRFETTSTGIAVVGDIKIDSALLSNQENTDVDTGTETVANVAIATYTAAFFDFVIKKTTNVRSGTVYACHDGTNVEFTETSTQDLGDTSDVTLSVDISGTNMRLLATVTSDDWSVKSLIRAI